VVRKWKELISYDSAFGHLQVKLTDVNFIIDKI
jgi:hypothetical protein